MIPLKKSLMLALGLVVLAAAVILTPPRQSAQAYKASLSGEAFFFTRLPTFLSCNRWSSRTTCSGSTIRCAS